MSCWFIDVLTLDIKASLASSQTDLSSKTKGSGGSDVHGASDGGGKQATWVLPQMSDTDCKPSAVSCQ